MKIDKNEFEMNCTLSDSPEEFINKVIYQFEPMIRNSNINVYTVRKNTNFGQMETDWDKYQLILFNIIQNAVKYNMIDGNILIALKCMPMKSNSPKNIFEQKHES